ncbi:MAG: cobyrinate a,c-diamide synthase, partial [Thermodesulfatator sp.]
MTGITPSILVAGVSSGCGKTTVSLGLMAALREMGEDVQAFKCGPDFIDTSLHRMVTGKTSWNLDVRMCGRGYVRSLFNHVATRKGINVVEGVMGLFDGGEASAANLARLLEIPVILVVDASSAAESIAAVIRGFEEMDPGIDIPGIILNRIASPRHLELIQEAVSNHCRSRIIGALRRNRDVHIPSRHLGLFMDHETPLGENLSQLASFIREFVDIKEIMKISTQAASRAYSPASPFSQLEELDGATSRVPVGIAQDEAFCFYYPDNLKLLEIAGAELVPFSPIRDQHLPDGIQGLYLGGGYPELYCQDISLNHTMRSAVRRFSMEGRPLFAECGGFMYLCRWITDNQGQAFEMAGIFPGNAFMQKRLSSLGYRDVTINAPCVLGSPGDRLNGHEFHYSRTEFQEPVDQVFS